MREIQRGGVLKITTINMLVTKLGCQVALTRILRCSWQTTFRE